VPELEQNNIAKGRKLSPDFDQLMREEVAQTRLLTERSGGHETTCRALIDLWPDLISPRREPSPAPASQRTQLLSSLARRRRHLIGRTQRGP
jgi:hypothetical protein